MKKSDKVLAASAVIAVLMLLFPPWSFDSKGRTFHVGYHFLFGGFADARGREIFSISLFQRHYAFDIDVSLLFAQLVVLAFVTVAAYRLWRK